MGLRARINLDDWGFPDETPTLHLPITYDGIGEVFTTTTTGLAKGVCPVDTGFLQNSIVGSGGDKTGVVEAGAEYAQYVEYGTWKMSAQPYFTPAVENGAQFAFMKAYKIYQKKMIEEARLLQQQHMKNQKQSSGQSGPLSPAQGGLWGGSTQTVHGIEFKKDGSVAAGASGYYKINPSMWRPGTTMYDTAMNNVRNLSNYRAEAMSRFEHDKAIRSSTLVSSGSMSRASSGGGDSWATHFGYSVGMYSMSSIIAGGGSYLKGLFGGMLLGGLATLVGLVLSDIFGSDDSDEGPQFSMPEIEIT